MTAKRVKSADTLRALLDPEAHLEQLRNTLEQLKVQASSTVIQGDLLGEPKEDDEPDIKAKKEAYEKLSGELTDAILKTQKWIEEWAPIANQKAEAEGKVVRIKSRKERRKIDRELGAKMEVDNLKEAVREPDEDD